MWGRLGRWWRAWRAHRPTLTRRQDRQADRLTRAERDAIAEATRAQQALADELAVEMAVIRGEQRRQ